MKLHGDLGKAIAGQKMGLQDTTETVIAGERLYPGDPVFQKVGDEKFGYGARVSAVSLEASAELEDGNEAVLTVNGAKLPPAPFVASSLDTFRSMAEAVNLNGGLRALGITAFLLEGEPLKLFVTGPGMAVDASVIVTGGAKQAVFTSSPHSRAKFRGVARHTDMSFKEGAGFYPAGAAVSVMTRGQIVVRAAEAAAPDNLVPAYVITAGPEAGRFTSEAAGNYDCGCFFRSGRLEGDLVIAEVNGLK